MQPYFSLRLQPPQEAGIRHPGEARKWLSRLAGGQLPPELWHRDEQGRALQGPCPYSFRGDGDRVYLTAVGAEAGGKLLSWLPVLVAVGAKPEPAGAGVVGAEVLPYLAKYRVKKLVLSTGGGAKAHGPWAKPVAQLRTLQQKELSARAARLLQRGLEAYAAECNIELDTDEDPLVIGDVVACGTAPVSVTGRNLYAVEVTFRANRKFTGPWFVGRCRGTSCGRIERDLTEK